MTNRIDRNSREDQREKDVFVMNQVRTNITLLVEYILSVGQQQTENSSPPLFTYDDISNLFVFPEFIGKYANFAGGALIFSEKEREIERLRHLAEEMTEDGNPEIVDITEEIEELENLEEQPAAVYEWYIVSDWFAGKLEECGECVIMDYSIWGRTTTGQMISMDRIISRIYFED